MCPGPPDTFKFVVNGQHSTGGGKKHGNEVLMPKCVVPCNEQENGTASAQPSRIALIRVKHRVAANGAAYTKLRMLRNDKLFIEGPKPCLDTQADKLASRLRFCMASSEGTGYDISIAMINLPQLPQLLPGSETLQTTLQLYLSTWLRFRQGSSFEEALDLHMYNKAIRSLRDVLSDSSTQGSEATLAATLVLTKVEVGLSSALLFSYEGPAGLIRDLLGLLCYKLPS